MTGVGKDWNEAREQCQKWGADLAVYGIRNSTIARFKNKNDNQ